MIISVSRRTDIPNHYSDWFFHRLREKWVLVRNPRNPHQLSRLSLSPEEVDGFVFWTKNPASMLERLGELDDYAYYFQFTLTPYGTETEPNLPSKTEVLLPLFQRLSQRLGRNRVIWRYDPIFFNSRYTLEFHQQQFAFFADRLGDFTERCTLSFLDFYATTRRRMASLGMISPTQEEKIHLLESMVMIAQKVGLSVDACAEKEDFRSLGIPPASCVDSERLLRLNRRPHGDKKDPYQRPECGCSRSRDIGAYDTCPNGCRYCYANHHLSKVTQHVTHHDPRSPLLFGQIQAGDYVTSPALHKKKEVPPSLSVFDEKEPHSDPTHFPNSSEHSDF